MCLLIPKRLKRMGKSSKLAPTWPLYIQEVEVSLNNMTLLLVFRRWASILASALLCRNFHSIFLANIQPNISQSYHWKHCLNTKYSHFWLIMLPYHLFKTPNSPVLPHTLSLSPSSHLLHQVHPQNLFYISFLGVARNGKQHRCPSTEGWIDSVYTMEYYSGNNNNNNNKNTKWLEICRQIDANRKKSHPEWKDKYGEL